MELIPALDLRDGRCVRLYQGDFQRQTAYQAEPLALLQRYASLGARWIHIVDLDGARNGVRTNTNLITNLVRGSSLSVQVGGGVRTREDVAGLLAAGVARVVIGSVAVQRPADVMTWMRDFGPERVCLAFDVRTDEAPHPRVHTHGWTRPSALSLWDALESFASSHARHVLCTDIARDGTLQGPNLDLYQEAVARHPGIAWQASGGIRSGADLAALAAIPVAAAVSGKALLESRITEQELRPFLPDASSPASTCAPARS
jgi:phosphoribosylformimino-5-aminoimidazole carboxamide ribotide isomerase